MCNFSSRAIIFMGSLWNYLQSIFACARHEIMAGGIYCAAALALVLQLQLHLTLFKLNSSFSRITDCFIFWSNSLGWLSRVSFLCTLPCIDVMDGRSWSSNQNRFMDTSASAMMIKSLSEKNLIRRCGNFKNFLQKISLHYSMYKPHRMSIDFCSHAVWPTHF